LTIIVGIVPCKPFAEKSTFISSLAIAISVGIVPEAPVELRFKVLSFGILNSSRGIGPLIPSLPVMITVLRFVKFVNWL